MSPKWPLTEMLYRLKQNDSTEYGKSRSGGEGTGTRDKQKAVLNVAGGNGSILKPARAAEKMCVSFPSSSSAWPHSVLLLQPL